jgi:glutathione synthase/RimK-type ligase-like ATP-grasp enzyme
MGTSSSAKELIVLVDHLNDWAPFHPTDQVVEAKDYLFNVKFQEAKNLHILNLCSNMKYLALGYYASLVAEARGHRIFPNIMTINDLSKKQFYSIDLEELQDYIKQNQFKDNASKELKFSIFFGNVADVRLVKLAKHIFELYPCPILEIILIHKNDWRIKSIKPGNITHLTNEEQDFFAKSLDRFSTKIWRTPKNKKYYKYDIAVLVNVDEDLPPSNEKALTAFEKACEKRSVYCERISKKDIYRVPEFDALFIRETTAINNHTYRFAKVAKDEGVVVIDDPTSMLKCTNKIFLENLLKRNHVPTIPSTFVSDSGEDTVELLEREINYPMVLKIPDGSFSKGVKKVANRDELLKVLKEMLKNTSLILVQKFLYTDYDWRIGVLDGKPIFICKYFMSEGHWQIYNHGKKQSSDDFSGLAHTLSVEETPDYVLEVALKATKLIGKGLYGVDLKEKEGKVYIVEINDNPNIDFGVEDRYLKDKLYDNLVEYFIEQIESKRKIK